MSQDDPKLFDLPFDERPAWLTCAGFVLRWGLGFSSQRSGLKQGYFS
jgi:hypothetical protein